MAVKVAGCLAQLDPLRLCKAPPLMEREAQSALHRERAGVLRTKNSDAVVKKSPLHLLCLLEPVLVQQTAGQGVLCGQGMTVLRAKGV